MIASYRGHFVFSKSGITNSAPTSTGVYYCGVQSQSGGLTPFYIGKASGLDGIQGRLLQHVNDNKWPDVVLFGFELCSTENEALAHEANEIAKYRPKYNVQGK